MAIPPEMIESVATENVKTTAAAGAHYQAQNFGAAAAAYQNGLVIAQTGLSSFISAMALMWKRTAENEPEEALANSIVSQIATKAAQTTPPATA